MRIAHARDRNAPAGTPWRLVAALGPGAAVVPTPSHWLDLEIRRRRLVARDPGREHNAVLFRQPITTLDDHLARGLRATS